MSSIRCQLDALAKLDFDEAFAEIRAGLRRGWPEESRGVALFARGLMGGRFFLCIPCRLPFADQMGYYRVPDFRLLLSLKESSLPCVVLMAKEKGVELLRLESGQARMLAWVTASRMLESPDEQVATLPTAGTDPARSVGMRYARQLIVRALGVAGGIPLVLAGEAGPLVRLWNWLPPQLRLAVRQQLVHSPFVVEVRTPNIHS